MGGPGGSSLYGPPLQLYPLPALQHRLLHADSLVHRCNSSTQPFFFGHYVQYFLPLLIINPVLHLSLFAREGHAGAGQAFGQSPTEEGPVVYHGVLRTCILEREIFSRVTAARAPSAA